MMAGSVSLACKQMDLNSDPYHPYKMPVEDRAPLTEQQRGWRDRRIPEGPQSTMSSLVGELQGRERSCLKRQCSQG